MKAQIALAAAIILGIIAAIGLRVYMLRVKEEQARKQNTIMVVAAKRALPKGEPIMGPEVLELKEVPEDLVGPNNIQQHQQHRLIGRRPMMDIARGEVLLWSYFLSPADIKEVATEKLQNGERAVTLKVDQVSGVAGLILPGSRVDVLGTFNREARDGKSLGFYTRPLLANVPVIAIDHHTSLVNLANDQRLQQGGYSSVTVAVKAEAARLLVFAQSQGTLTLVLRKPTDTGIETDRSPITPETMDSVADRLLEMEKNRAGAAAGGP